MSRDFYPTGQVTLDGGVLVQADKYSAKYDNSMKLEGTLANPDAAPVVGMRSVEVSWDMKVDNNGPELAMLSAVNAAAPMMLGFKFPNLGISTIVKATAASASIAQSLGDVCVISCTAKGSTANNTGV
jgi:hypothetical protein